MENRSRRKIRSLIALNQQADKNTEGKNSFCEISEPKEAGEKIAGKAFEMPSRAGADRFDSYSIAAP